MIPTEIEAVALLGWRLYPASRRTKKACFPNPTAQATHDLNTLAAWQREYGPCNWRVVMQGSGIWAIDLDVPSHDHAADGVAAFAELVRDNGPLPPRPATRSGGGGMALFFRHNGQRIIRKTGTPSPGIDPRAGGLSVTIPPSVHVTTRRPYRWIMPPWELSPPDAPAWLLKLLEPPPEPEYRRAPIDTSDAARSRLYRAAGAVADAQPGQRNDVLNRRAYQIGTLIGAGLLGEQEAIGALYGAARAAGLDHAEAKATIRSGVNSGMRRGASGR
jgi:hypothetical protein